MKKQEIDQILSETGTPCISIIIPMENILADKTKEPKAVAHAKELLKQNYSNIDINVNELIKRIDALVEQIEYTNTNEGIGIFVSANTAKLIKFPFPVKEKVKLKNDFEAKDLLYYANLMFDYYVLSISKKHLHLLKGCGKKLNEIKNEEFPIDYEETYEYAKPSRGTSYSSGLLKEYEKDKSVMQEIRLIDFLKTADHQLKAYLNHEIPLIVSGGSKEIADFMSITHHKKSIIGKVTGNYHFNGNTLLTSLSWDEIRSYLKKENENLLANLHELTGKEMVSFGLKDVWKAANEGKGLKLIVEKDFEQSGYISNDGYDLKLGKVTGNKKYTFDSDVVERIIRLVMEKRGKVIFVENGELDYFDRIALQLRYSISS